MITPDAFHGIFDVLFDFGKRIFLRVVLPVGIIAVIVGYVVHF
jgi:hypothetical protein